MPDFNVRSDSVNVEQIMEQIRARIREKRGVDYTEQQIRELAAVKLEKFLDPRGVRSDLLEQFRRAQPPYEPPELPNYAFEDTTLFESHRGAAPLDPQAAAAAPEAVLQPEPADPGAAHPVAAEHDATPSARRGSEAARRRCDQLYYELMHNLVVETTRIGIEVKNLKMRVESLASRLEFNERRARALESVVVYKPRRSETGRPRRRSRPPPQRAAAVEQPRRPSRAARPTYRPRRSAAGAAARVRAAGSAAGGQPGAGAPAKARASAAGGGGDGAAAAAAALGQPRSMGGAGGSRAGDADGEATPKPTTAPTASDRRRPTSPARRPGSPEPIAPRRRDAAEARRRRRTPAERSGAEPSERSPSPTIEQ